MQGVETKMIFSENDCETFVFKSNNFIYFLLYKNDVVYVGQTTQGVLRPLSHKDKKYDTIKIKYCDKCQLDVLEDEFIAKYSPKYNKKINQSAFYTFQNAKSKIRNEIKNKSITIFDLKKSIKRLGIPLVELSGKKYISKQNFEKILNEVKERVFDNVSSKD